MRFRILVLIRSCSDGMIIFPAAGVFDHLGGVGVSMFFVTSVSIPTPFEAS